MGTLSDPLSGIAAVVKGCEGDEGHGFMLVPFVRVPSTDLNFTASLAVVSVIMTQVIGLRAQGPHYFKNF